mmetsp:Transcript_104490/g.239424  ORF Transcript_104490/g.239424 Transcript_104490/m.239424 type:complete len:110 (+) Transcript_104490:1673-2002(+)
MMRTSLLFDWVDLNRLVPFRPSGLALPFTLRVARGAKNFVDFVAPAPAKLCTSFAEAILPNGFTPLRFLDINARAIFQYILQSSRTGLAIEQVLDTEERLTAWKARVMI